MRVQPYPQSRIHTYGPPLCMGRIFCFTHIGVAVNVIIANSIWNSVVVVVT